MTRLEGGCVGINTAFQAYIPLKKMFYPVLNDFSDICGVGYQYHKFSFQNIDEKRCSPNFYWISSAVCHPASFSTGTKPEDWASDSRNSFILSFPLKVYKNQNFFVFSSN